MPKTKDLTPTGRREQILDEALRLFIEHGADRVSTRLIAEAVGISQPSLYAHFPTSDSIAVELCCRAFEDLYQRLVAADRSSRSPMKRLRALAMTYVEFGLTNAPAYQVAFMRPVPDPGDPIGDRVLAAGVRAFGVLRGLFDDLVDDPDRADAWAQSTWASLHGLVSLLIVRAGFPWVDRATLIALHVDALCRQAQAIGRSR